MRYRRKLLIFLAGISLTGCHPSVSPPAQSSPFQSPPEIAHAANQVFAEQNPFNPWTLAAAPGVGSAAAIPAYLSNGEQGLTILATHSAVNTTTFQAGHYQRGMLQPIRHTSLPFHFPPGAQEKLDLQTGILTFEDSSGKTLLSYSENQGHDWPGIWKDSDIVIAGDPEAQQAVHANLFYLLSSASRGGSDSIPPLGLSTTSYGGHIFWDADVWMLPALIAQHPDYAQSIVNYRFKLLAQAERNAKAHGRAGAEYPWESADTGKEMAPGVFAQERHITADVAWAAWQYYLWTGSRAYLQEQAWPILRETAQYWVSRVTKEKDGKYHILNVLSPDETAGLVNDDAYTNAVVQANLQYASRAARLIGQTPDPHWVMIAAKMFLPMDKALGFPAENDTPLNARFSAKQADTLLLLYPLNLSYPGATQAKMLAYYTAHTIPTGPAMTASIESVIASRLGMAPLSLTDFDSSYQPFERGPWDAFSEARTTDNVYFLTGMAGCLQSVLYGFAGLHVYEAGQKPVGTYLAGDSIASLYADPHLPPGWGSLTLEGIQFRGKCFTLHIGSGNAVTTSDLHPAPALGGVYF